MSFEQMQLLLENIGKRLDAAAKLGESNAKDFAEMKQMDKEIRQTIGGFTKSEADAIEEAANKDVQHILPDVCNECAVYRVNDSGTFGHKLISHLKTEAANKKTREITEFDGLYILSSDPTYNISDVYGTQVATPRTKPNTFNTQFVVLEAKHSFDNGKINVKVAQMRKFVQYIKDATNFDARKHTGTYKDVIENLHLQTFSPSIILILAAPNFPDTSREYIREMYNIWRRQNVIVWFMTQYELNFVEKGRFVKHRSLVV